MRAITLTGISVAFLLTSIPALGQVVLTTITKDVEKVEVENPNGEEGFNTYVHPFGQICVSARIPFGPSTSQNCELFQDGPVFQDCVLCGDPEAGYSLRIYSKYQDYKFLVKISSTQTHSHL